MELFRIDVDKLAEYPNDVLSEGFGFGDIKYFAGIKLFNRVNRQVEGGYKSAKAV